MNTAPSAKLNRFDAIRFQLNQDTSRAADRVSAGLPTPPQSETTSNASVSGDFRGARKDLHGALPSYTDVPGLLKPSVSAHDASASSRSPSVTSSSNHTGSDTIGATSPHHHPRETFRSSQPPLATGANMETRPAASVSNSASDQRISEMPGSNASPSALRSSSSLSSGTTNSPRERRKRRSEMHERDVSQIRSESRMGFANEDDNDAAAIDEPDVASQQQPFPRASQHKYSPRKSTTLSVASSRYDETEAAVDHERSPRHRDSPHRVNTHLPITHASASSSHYVGADDTSSGSMRRLVNTTGRTSGRTSLDDRTSPRISTASRSPMPSEFRLPDKEIRRAYRAAHQRTASDDSDASEPRQPSVAKPAPSEPADDVSLRSPVSTRRESLDEIQEEGATRKSIDSHSPHNRRRRYASDAASSAAPDEVASKLDYDGRLGTQGSRISVDSSSAQRYLARGSIQSTPSSSARRTPHSSDFGSPSEEARARKISSTSSNRSQKSSNSASELHRAASRVSMRRQYGSDLFSAEAISPPSSTNQRPYSPSASSLTNSSDRSRAHLDHSRRVDDAALDHLRNQIQELHVGRAAAEHDRRLIPLHGRVQPGSARGSITHDSPSLGSVRSQSVMGLQRTPNDHPRILQMQQHPSTDPQRSRYDRNWPLTDPTNSSDAVHRIHELVGLRGGVHARQPGPHRSATAMGTAAGSSVSSPAPIQRDRNAAAGDEPAPIRNLTVRLAQYEALYTKTPSADATTSATQGPHTARTVELMGAIVRGTSTMWTEVASMHPIATEGHLMGRPGDALTDAFDQLDEGLAFVNKLVLEQARAMQDLLFLLDRTEKERQSQFNQALVELGHSPRPFSRIDGSGGAPLTPASAKLANGMEASRGSDRSAQLLRRATSSVRDGSASHRDSLSPFNRPSRGVGTAERGATLTATQLRSMTSLGHTSAHGRSASELSPSSAAAQRRLDRLTFESAREASQDSPLSSRRSVMGQHFPTSGASQTESTPGETIAAGTASSRPAPAFTPRRPRLSNPSVSNATASFQPAAASTASSVFASSPENSLHNGLSGAEQMDSEGSTVGGETDEFGRVPGAHANASLAGDTLRQSSRGQRSRAARSGVDATVRGGPRIVDTLASQLDTFRGIDGQSAESIPTTAQTADQSREGTGHQVSRRHTLSFNPAASSSTVLSDPDDGNRSPPKLSQYGLTKSNNPPPRPPRHVQRPSEESITSPARRPQQASRNEPSTPTSAQPGDIETPRQKDRSGASTQNTGGYDDDLTGAGLVRSLGRTAARRVSRVLGSGQ
ncbi:hypothetical protein PHSY_004671 [Pseudozyma hubeiensis SY62]|uniref:Uncharacterized protein n=1 Tax=Pseudozyma hubeiensis (strain SY62) TaxID=1305764 RepID=R9P759_PSEHS|nr:hypothetical protein PHSY_004671 [Pseudozyma hubeiensis SY62]GAC97087.1 hypothetical protein PHSY_004671 [Pseudozyma hubeiensis SY62]